MDAASSWRLVSDWAAAASSGDSAWRAAMMEAASSWRVCSDWAAAASSGDSAWSAPRMEAMSSVDGLYVRWWDLEGGGGGVFGREERDGEAMWMNMVELTLSQDCTAEEAEGGEDADVKLHFVKDGLFEESKSIMSKLETVSDQHSREQENGRIEELLGICQTRDTKKPMATL